MRNRRTFSISASGIGDETRNDSFFIIAFKNRNDADIGGVMTASSENQPFDDLKYSYEKYQHDPFFKSIFGKPEFSRKFLRWALPSDVLERLDLANLRRYQESFLDDRLKSSFADLLFKVPIKSRRSVGNGDANAENEAGAKEAIVFVLLEHKTFNDKWTIYQIFRYVSRIWEQEYQEAVRAKTTATFALPIVVPLIVHHGVQPFSAPTSLQDLAFPFEPLASYAPKFDGVLIDLNRREEDELPHDMELRIVLSVMQAIFREDILDRIETIYQKYRKRLIREESTKRFFKKILFYTFTSARFFNQERFERMVSQMSDITNDVEPKSWLDGQRQIFFNEGRNEGKLEGKLEGKTEGKALGKAEEKRSTLERVLHFRFGDVSKSAVPSVAALTDVDQLERLVKASFESADFSDFMKILKRETNAE